MSAQCYPFQRKLHICRCHHRHQYHQQHNCDQKPCHFLVPSCKRQIYRYARKGGGSGVSVKTNATNSWYLFGCLLAAQLIFATQVLAQTVNVYHHDNTKHPITPPLLPNSMEEDFVLPPPSPLANSENILDSETPTRTKGERRPHVSISDIDKEVVERLIKQWAPVVWLAPEEKFMPLGVEEFLAHVHPESKDKIFTPGMPLGDDSEESYLVTNAEIDQLLENETSFLYGRNPNVSPVPIYAVVTLCDNKRPHQTLQTDDNSDAIIYPTVKSTKSLPQFSFATPVVKSVPTVVPSVHHSYIAKPTRGPYIPVTLGPQDLVDNTLRRSSRLYPVFQRVKRMVSPLDSIYIQPPPISPHDLVMGESVPPSEIEVPNPTTTENENNDNANDSVNNFIANLADNVKFSIPYTDRENSLVNENNLASQEFNYKDGIPVPSFHVTYWMFYPYSQGKNMCTLSLGPFGRIPFPAVYGYCLGRKKDIGSHIGDWEHMTLYFTGATEPEAMYVSAHDAGAYYAYNRLTGSFEFRRQETRKGILQRPNFPKTVTTFNDHPVLFAAKGSHGIWTAPGKHRFVKVARLYDINGFGTPWNTWKSVDITYENLRSYGRSLAPTWLSFKGRWGNPKSRCHPLRRVGLNFCEFADGPTGIPLKEPHFQCGALYRRR